MGVDGRIGAGPAAADEELDYLQRRAEQELEMAQRSASPEATAAHYQLAEAYLERMEARKAATPSGGGENESADSEDAAPVADPMREAEPAARRD